MAALKNQMQSMLPSADDDTRSTKEFLQHPLETVPYFQRPMGSSTDDPQVGQDDAGNPVFKGSLGEYTVRVNPDQRTLRTKVKEAIPVVKEAVGDYLEDPKLPTKDQLSEFAKQAGQSAVGSVEDLGDLMFKGKGTYGDVVGLAVGAGTGSIPFSVPEGALRTFGGGGAKNIDSKIFSKAEDLWNANTDNEEIRKQTGWYKDDADRKWRFEIDDSQMKLTGEGEFDWSDPDGIRNSLSILKKAPDGPEGWSSTAYDNLFTSGRVALYLKDFLNHKKLFKHYPQLKDYKIILNDTDLGTNVVGSFNATDKEFSLSPQAMQDPEYAKNILIHELQHGIQEIEGFLPGSNTSETAFLAAKRYGDEAESISKTLESFGFNMDDDYLTQVSNLAEQFNSLPLTEDQKISANKYFTRLIDLDEKLQRAEKNEYLYYVNRSGEVEANLAADRMDLTETERASFSPIADKFNQITDEVAYRAVDPIIDRRQGQSDILLDDIDFEYGPSSTRPQLNTFKYKGKEGDYEELYDDRIRDFLKSDKSTKGLANLKTGQIVKLGPDNKEYFFLRFTRDDLAKSRLNKNYPHVFHEEMGSEDYPKMASVHLLRVPKPKDERAELLKFIKNPYGTAPNFSFKVKSFSLGDLMFDSNKSTAKPENTGAFRDSIEEQKSFLGLFNRDKKKSPLSNQTQYADKPKDFNKGGAVMNEQMEMAFMQQGGLKDDGMKRDPVSGNEVPNGSMASEVRDDIPAQLSEGEYVVPADVVRYLGVKHFEDLRDKAKSGLQSMEANGRIGGEPVPVGVPQAAPMMPQPSMAMGGDLSPEEMNEINSIMMAQGGMTPTDPYQQQQMQYTQPVAQGLQEGGQPLVQPPAVPKIPQVSPYSSFTPSGNFSWENSVSITDTEVPVENEASCEARGLVYNPDTKMCEVPLEPEAPVKVGGDGSGIDEDEGEDPTTWMDNYDYTNFNTLAQQTSAALDGPSTMLGGAAEFIFGGGVLGKFAKASNAAQVAANIAVLKAQGQDVSELTTKFNNYVNSNNLGGLKNFITGSKLAKQISATQIDVPLGLDSTDVFGNKIFKDKVEFNKQMEKVAPKGMTYQPGKDDDDPGAYVRPGSAAPSTSPKPPSKPSGIKPVSNNNRDPGPSGAEVARAAANRPAAASRVAKSEGVSAPTSGGARSVSAPKSETKGTGKKETYASKVERGGGFNKGGLASRPKKK